MDLRNIIEQAHMAGQHDAGVDAGYSNARAYCDGILKELESNGIKPLLCEVPKCEAERYQFEKVLLQRLNKDCLWYAVYNGQIIDVDRYRSDLEERVRHFA